MTTRGFLCAALLAALGSAGCASETTTFGSPSGEGGAGAGSGGTGTGGNATGGNATGGDGQGGSATGTGTGTECTGPSDCDDDDACTEDDCAAGSCSHLPVDPDDGDACTTDACDPGSGVSHTPVDPDDSDACTTDACDPESGVSHTPVDPDDDDACTVDACDPGSGPSHLPVDPGDGDVCTLDSCDPQTGVAHVADVVLFEEDFADNTQGWALGQEWDIGPAVASSGGQYGADPGSDHSAGNDNGVAGVVIGGHPATGTIHGFYYLTSPSFDTSGATRSLVLSFWRWLVSDWSPYMRNTVDVWNGAQWVNLSTTGVAPGVDDSPPSGGGWIELRYDVTAYASAAMRVRFGFDVGQLPAWEVGSWSLDDIAVLDTAAAADDDACTVDSCHPLNGATYAPLDIDDADACTTDSCQPLRGIRHAAIDPDDDNACTVDACDPVTGPSHDPVVCSDGQACTLDTCNPLYGCVFTPTPTPQPHGKCVAGGPLTSNGCADPCIVQICSSYPSCCASNGSWSATCVQAVRTVCGSLVCPEATGTCAHSPCVENGTTTPLAIGCDATRADCVSQVCAYDPFCCSSDWDSLCVGFVDSVCGYTCN